MSLKLLTEHYLEFLSLTGGCTGSSEATLVKMPHCWKSRVIAQFSLFDFRQNVVNFGCLAKRFFGHTELILFIKTFLLLQGKLMLSGVCDHVGIEPVNSATATRQSLTFLDG